MQNSDLISVNPSRAWTWHQVVWRGLLSMLMLLVLGLACGYGTSRRESFAIYPKTPLPSGSLIFTNHFAMFQLDSNEPIDKPVTTLYTTTTKLSSPSLSPDGSKVVFVWTREMLDDPSALMPSKGLYSLDTASDRFPDLLWWGHDGLAKAKIDDPFPSSPQWSADGKWVVFLIGVAGLGTSNYRDVYRLDPETLILEQMIECKGYCQSVIPAPISDRLLFTSLYETEVETGTISLLEENGTARVLISDEGIDYVTRPSWSPDESQIAFTMQTDEQSRQVFLFELDGTKLVQLTNDSTCCYHSPVWSPDGETLAFVQKSYLGSGGIASRIVLMDLQTQKKQTLLVSPTQLADLQWSR